MALCSESTGRTSAPASRRFAHEGFARANEAFLVGQRDHASAPDGGDGGPQSRRAGDGAERPVDRPLRGLAHRLFTGCRLDAAARKSFLQVLVRIWV